MVQLYVWARASSRSVLRRFASGVMDVIAFATARRGGHVKCGRPATSMPASDIESASRYVPKYERRRHHRGS